MSIHALEAPLALAISIGWTQAKESPETLQVRKSQTFVLPSFLSFFLSFVPPFRSLPFRFFSFFFLLVNSPVHYFPGTHSISISQSILSILALSITHLHYTHPQFTLSPTPSHSPSLALNPLPLPLLPLSSTGIFGLIVVPDSTSGPF